MQQPILNLLGITRREVDIYLLLVEKGALSAREISEQLNIPYTKVYTYLSKLQKLGAVIIEEKPRPQRYRALPPVDIYKKLVSATSEALRQIKPFFDSLQLIYESKQVTPTFLTLIKGREKIVELIEEVIKSTETEVYVALPFIELLTHRLLTAIVEESRRVAIKMLINDQLRPHLDLPPRIEVRTTQEMFGGGVIGNAVVIFVRHGGELSGIYSNERHLIEIARTYFNHLWQRH